ncbi:HAD domain-containing protein [Clostridium cellulovorans]|uniref:Uncharacterized protein n=1 Tax=Clostridium cellulovorans (strain ATCC 35296 / DSM 3052 / OCM 3 / 743B) TaxID=573061 RepID=D9SNT8_CLOC7|nr:HAD domain-containing protein [Clostridium cellulovorans]ADL49959.1 hypothetical protein Clocel_0172 [Clostridium cellulovorans 743B]
MPMFIPESLLQKEKFTGDKATYTIESLMHDGTLLDLLLDSGLSIYAMPPDLTTEEIRKTKMFSRVKAVEIILWLKQNQNIDKWIVFHDIHLHNEDLAIRQVRTNAEIGLTEKRC